MRNHYANETKFIKSMSHESAENIMKLLQIAFIRAKTVLERFDGVQM